MLVAFKAEAQTSALAVSDSLYAVGEYAEAINKLQGITPQTEKTYLKLAKNYAASRQPEIALENYKKVLSQNPERVLTTIDYGELLVKSGKLKLADSLFKDQIGRAHV